MLNFSQFTQYWRNTYEMPVIFRVLCQGGMVVGPFFLLLMAIPLKDWEVDGRQLSYAEFWSSGYGPAFSAAMALFSAGTWGLAARKPWSRWLVILGPTIPHIVLATFATSPIYVCSPNCAGVFIEAAATSAGLYVCLFHVRPFRDYLRL